MNYQAIPHIWHSTQHNNRVAHHLVISANFCSYSPCLDTFEADQRCYGYSACVYVLVLTNHGPFLLFAYAWPGTSPAHIKPGNAEDKTTNHGDRRQKETKLGHYWMDVASRLLYRL